MNIQELLLQSLGIEKEKFGKIFSFVDFGNVNYWYDKDRQGLDGSIIPEGRKLIIGIEKLGNFLDSFSEQKRFYYGWNNRLTVSQHMLVFAEKCGFIKITKPIQYIRHYLSEEESKTLPAHKKIKSGHDGSKYIEIPKSNFDVEISIDSIRLLPKYDTICLLSGDSDFAQLALFLKKKGKKVIVIASGQVFHTLKDAADLYVNAQKVKQSIAILK